MLKDAKYKLRNPDEVREVTGLIVGTEGVSLPADFVPRLETEIERLNHLTDVQMIMQRADSAWAQDYQEAVRGKLGFMAMVLGRDNAEYRRLNGAFHNALSPPDDFEAISWLHFNYHV